MALSSDSWRRLEEIFHRALELTAPERQRYLDDACAAKPELRAEVEAMLAANDGAGERIEGAILGTFELAAADDSDAPRWIGPYEIRRELGRGGMSTVYLAERTDEHFHKRVAIKVIRRGMDTRDMLARLRQERQILAGLEHPNIAGLHDGGNTDDGLPYFVMEYVDGEPIDRYCDRRKISIAERLELFRDVCSAVQYAHGKLIIHRDLKPSNLLVTKDGTPKLLDFGIAKLLEPAPGTEAAAPTATGRRLLTPEYASPEQVRGEPLTTATDVYSLGMLLYELLTGHRAYRVDRTRGKGFERLICEIEPIKPSTAVRRVEEIRGPEGTVAVTPEVVSRSRSILPKRLRRRLVGDLDTIVLMALRKEPLRRYASVEQLAEDLRRHLKGLPVRARRDTVGYRLQKFVRRHRVAVAATAMVLAIVASLIGFYTVRLRHERDRAQLEESKSAQVAKFLTGLFEGADPRQAKGEEVTALELLDLGAELIEEELRGQPKIRADMMDLMGRIYRRLGKFDEAELLLKNARDLRRELHGLVHPDVAASLNNLGNLDYDTHHFKAAEKLFRQALQMRREVLNEDDPEIATSLNDLAAALYQLGDYAAAEPMYRQALARRLELFGAENGMVAETSSGLASTLYRLGQDDEAETLYRQALGIRRQLYGSLHPGLAISLINLGAFLSNRGDFAAAETLHREGADMEAELFGPEHPNAAINLHDLGILLRQKGDLENAERTLKEAAALSPKVRGPGHREQAFILRKIGDLLLWDRQQPAAAAEHYRQALSIERARDPEGDWRTSFCLVGLGESLLQQGDARGAAPLFRQAAAIRRRERPPGNRRTAEAESALGVALADLRQTREASSLLLDNYPILLKGFGPGDPRVRRAWRQAISVLGAMGRTEDIEHFRTRHPDPATIQSSPQ